MTGEIVMNLYILPFDHRSTFVKGIFGFSYPLTRNQRQLVEQYKELVFGAFLKARKEYRGKAKKEDFVIFIDEEFGAPIIRDAKKERVPFAIAVEESGSKVFQFVYGKEFGKHILSVKPRFAKALVHYLPGNTKENIEQSARLKQLIRFCRRHSIATIVEVLMVKPQAARRSEVANNFEKFVRPRLTAKAIQELAKRGVVPTVWKLEPQETQTAWRKIIRAVNGIPIVVLGGGESQEHIESRLKLAARFPEIIGFAIGRTVFLEVLKDLYIKKVATRQAVKSISNNFLHIVSVWEQERKV